MPRKWWDNLDGHAGRRRNPPGLVVYYNGACPVCRTEMTRYREIAGTEGGPIGWYDVAAAGSACLPAGVSLHGAKRRLHVADETGRVHVGVDAFVVLWERLPGFAFYARLLRLPGVHGCAAWAYDHLVSAPLYAWARSRERHGSPAAR